MMSGGREIELKTPTFFVRPEAFQPAPLSEKVENGNGVTLDKLDVCEGEGFPPINNNYLSGVHRAIVLSRDAMDVNTAAATHDRFADIHKDDPDFDENWDNAVVFYEPGDPPPGDAIPIDDALFKQIMGATKYVQFKTLTGDGRLKFCRSKDNRHVWAYAENKMLDKKCTDDHALKFERVGDDALPKSLQGDTGKIRLIHATGLKGVDYCWAGGTLLVSPKIADRVEPDWLGVAWDFLKSLAGSEAKHDIQKNLATSTLLSPEEKEKVSEALSDALSSIRWMQRAQAAIGPSILASVIAGIGSLVYMRSNTKVLKAQTKEIDPKSFLKNITAEAKEKSFNRLVGGEEVIEQMMDVAAQTENRHMLITGQVDIDKTGDSAGSGKSEHIKKYLHLKAEEGYTVIELRAAKLGKAAAKYVGKPEEAVDKMFEYLEQLKKAGKKVIVWVKEAHTLKGIGTAQGHPTDVVEYFLDRMEERDGGSQIIFDTNKPWGIKGYEGLLDDEALGRRITIVGIPTTNIAGATTVTEQNAAKYIGKGNYTIDHTTLKTVAHLSPLGNKGSLPSRAYKLLDRVTTKLSREGQKNIKITEEMIIQIVAQDAKLTEAQVRNFLKLSQMAESRGIDPELLKGSLDSLRKQGFFVRNGRAMEPTHMEVFCEILEIEDPQERVAAQKMPLDSIVEKEMAGRGKPSGGSGRSGGPPQPPAGGSEPPAGGAAPSEPPAAGGAPPPPPTSAAPESPAPGDSAMVSNVDDLVKTLNTSERKLTLTARNLLDATLASGEKILVGDPNNKAMAMGVTDDAFITALQLGFDHDIPTRMQNANAILGATKDALDEDGSRRGGIINEADVIRSAAERTGTSESHVKTIVKLLNTMEDLDLIPPKDIINVLGKKSEGEIQKLIDEVKVQSAKEGPKVPPTSKTGSGKGGGEPPAAGGTPPAARGRRERGAKVSHELGKAAKNGGAEKPGKFGGSAAKRVAVRGSSLERTVGPAMVGTMVGSTVAEHFGVINAEQKQGIDIGMLGGMTAAHPALLWELPVAGPLMALGHEAAQAGLEEVGVGRETLTSKLAGLGGAFATAEAAAYAAGRMAGETGSRALAAGHQIFQNAVRQELPRRLHELKSAVTTGFSTGIQNIRAGAQLYGSQIAASGTAAWAAAKSGAVSAAARIAASPATAVAARLVVQANAIFGLFMMPEQMDAARPDKTPTNL